MHMDQHTTGLLPSTARLLVAGFACVALLCLLAGLGSIWQNDWFAAAFFLCPSALFAFYAYALWTKWIKSIV